MELVYAVGLGVMALLVIVLFVWVFLRLVDSAIP